MVAGVLGDDVGYTVIRETWLPSLAGSDTGATTLATSGCVLTAAASWSRAWVSAWPELTRHQQQRPVEAGPESRGQEVVGLPGGRADRVVALVGGAEPEREERQRHQHHHDQGHDSREHRPLAG